MIFRKLCIFKGKMAEVYFLNEVLAPKIDKKAL